LRKPRTDASLLKKLLERETDPTLLGSKNVAVDDILAIEPDARAKNGIALSLGIPRNA
jgi:hypothetical protein